MYQWPMSRTTPNRAGIEALARAVVALRTSIGWSQSELAHRAGMSQPMISRLERGQATDVTIGAAWRVLEAMGARPSLMVEPPYLGDRARQRDAAHARCTSHVGRRLERSGWVVAREVEVGGGRSRGWIDVLAFHPPTGLLLVIEVKTELHDLDRWSARLAGMNARRGLPRDGWAGGRAGSSALCCSLRPRPTSNGCDRTTKPSRAASQFGRPSSARRLMVPGSDRVAARWQ